MYPLSKKSSLRCFITIFLCLINTNAFPQNHQIGDTVFSITVNIGSENPAMYKSGMLNFGDSILIDETETLIMEWLEFIFYNNPEDFPSYLRKIDFSHAETEKLNTMIIDSTLLPIEGISRSFLLSILPSMDYKREIKTLRIVRSNYYLPIQKDNFNNEQYIDRVSDILRTPVTGLSFEQAILFCQWRTKVDSLRIFDDRYKVENYSEREMESYIFDLISPKEYDMFISNRDSLTSNKQWSTFNFKNATPPKKVLFKIIYNEYGKSLLSAGAYLYHRGD